MTNRIGKVAFGDLQALALVGSSNIAYFCGFRTVPYERLIALVVTDSGELRLVVPSLEEEAALAAIPDTAHCIVWRDEDGPSAALAQAFAGLAGPVGVEHDQLTLAQLALFRGSAPGIEFIDGGKLVASARIRKATDELDSLRRACAILDSAMERLGAESLQPGRTEIDVAADCARFVREAGGDTRGFDPIVLTGARSALPHGRAGMSRLTDGDLLVVDFGLSIDGYYADSTRTFVIGSPPDGRQRELFEVVRSAEKAGIEAARPGAAARDVDRAARTVIEEAGYGAYFVHRTGHGLGLDVHEPPWLTGSNEEALELDMVVTVEPGIYIPGYGGIRIEDDVRVDDPPEILTHAPIAY